VCHDSFMCVQRFIRMRVPLPIHVCAATHLYVCLYFAGCDKSTALTHSYVCTDPFICVHRPIHMCVDILQDATRVYTCVCNSSFIHVLICHRTRHEYAHRHATSLYPDEYILVASGVARVTRTRTRTRTHKRTRTCTRSNTHARTHPYIHTLRLQRKLGEL